MINASNVPTTHSHLCVTDQPGLRSVVRVDVSSSKSKGGVPCIGRGSISCSKSQDLSLCVVASSQGLVRSTANVAKLIADTGGDDVRVQGLLLAFVDNGVDGLEGELGLLATVESSLELDGWGAGSEVKTER